VVDATANGCGPFRGSVVTLTFSWNVRGETADLKLKQWLNTVERELKARVCFVASKECKHPRSEWRCLALPRTGCRSSLNTEGITRRHRRHLLSWSDRIPAWGVDADQAYFNACGSDGSLNRKTELPLKKQTKTVRTNGATSVHAARLLVQDAHFHGRKASSRWQQQSAERNSCPGPYRIRYLDKAVLRSGFTPSQHWNIQSCAIAI